MVMLAKKEVPFHHLEVGGRYTYEGKAVRIVRIINRETIKIVVFCKKQSSKEELAAVRYGKPTGFFSGDRKLKVSEQAGN